MAHVDIRVGGLQVEVGDRQHDFEFDAGMRLRKVVEVWYQDLAREGWRCDDPQALAAATSNDLMTRPVGCSIPPMISVAPAIGNALADATGVELLHMPIRAENVWRGLGDQEPIDNWITKSPAGHCRSTPLIGSPRLPVTADA